MINPSLSSSDPASPALALLSDASFSHRQITLVITAMATIALIGVLAGVSLIAPVVFG